MGRKRKRTRTELTIETVEVLAVKGTRRAVRAWCRVCAQEVSMVPVEYAAAVASVSPSTIQREVQSGKLHASETAEGRTLLCMRSLVQGKFV